MTRLDRRSLLTGLGAFSLAPQMARAADYIDLEWSDLMPEGQVAPPPMIPELLSHEGPVLSSSQPVSAGVRTEWNQKTVRLPGFIVPIDYSGSGVTAFILVPFVGACVHVPPPPANQLVFVTTEEPYESSGLFEAVSVTGTFGTSLLYTQLAEVACRRLYRKKPVCGRSRHGFALHRAPLKDQLRRLPRKSRSVPLEPNPIAVVVW